MMYYSFSTQTLYFTVGNMYLLYLLDLVIVDKVSDMFSSKTLAFG